MKKRACSTAGFSLVELIVAIVIASIMAGGMVHLFMVQNQAYMRQNDGVLASQNARAGFDMLVREMRNAGYDPRGLALAGITNWSPDTIAWTADLNADGDALDPDENVMFYYDAETQILVRRELLTDLIVAEDITALDLDYFQDNSGTVATASDQIHQIHVEMAFSTPQGVADGRLATQVAVRNNIY
jgi:prepilin-type N-terminal cleavage/methylation domain-containing protein